MDAHRPRHPRQRIGAKTLFEHRVPDWLGTGASLVLVAFAVFCFVAGVWRELVPGAPPTRSNVRRIPVWFLIAFNGFFVLLSLGVLIGFLVA